MSEPTDEEVAAFVESHPGGAVAEEIAPLFGISRQRLEQIINAATAKIIRQLRLRDIHSMGDVI